MEYLNPTIDDDDEDEPLDDADSETEPIAVQLPKGRCILCSEREPEMCVIPCFDFCICEACYVVLINNANEFRCPKCNTIATEAKKMNFV